MRLLLIPLVILATALFCFWVAAKVGREPRPKLARLADPTPLSWEPCEHEYTSSPRSTHLWCQKCDSVIPGPLPVAGYLPDYQPAPNRYGERFPVETGPQFIADSELPAAGDALVRYVRGQIAETEWLIEQGEQRIGPTP